MHLFVTICCSLMMTVPCGMAQGNHLSEKTLVPGFNLWITSQTYDPVRYEIGMMLAHHWKKLGFEVTITALEWPTMSSKGMKGHEHDAFIIQWGGKLERIDPMHWLYTLHHSSEAISGGYNIAGYTNTSYDNIVEQFITETDPVKRRLYAREAQSILARDVPQPPLVHRVITHAYNSNAFENPTFAMGEGLNSFWNWLSLKPKGKRKVARFGSINDIKLLNPLSTKTGTDIYILGMIYDSLFRIGPNGKLLPWAATSYRYIDPTHIAVTLKSGLSFHDGKPVTVEDVKYSFDLAKKVKSPTYFSKIKNLKFVEIKDSKTVLFALSSRYSPFITNVLGAICILPKHIWEPRYQQKGADGVLKWDNIPPIGSGPFKFVYWRPNEELKLARFSNHFRPPHIEEFIRIPYAKAYGVVQGLMTGEIDSAGWSLLPLEIESLASASHLTMGQIDDQGYYMLHYNLRKKPFNDVTIRRALSYAIPKKKIVEYIFEGQAVPAYSTVAGVNKYWHNPNIEKVGDDMEKARAILKNAGFRWDSKGKIHYPENYHSKKIY